jgi:hypothetical protein
VNSPHRRGVFGGTVHRRGAVGLADAGLNAALEIDDRVVCLLLSEKDRRGGAPGDQVTVRAIAVWCAIVPFAIANGAVRDLLIAPRAGVMAAHVISTALLCLAILGWSWLTIGWIRPAGLRSAVPIGVGWLALTLAFEFLAGHYLFGTPWRQLLADYDVAQGRVWILVPLTTAVAPWLAARWRHLSGATRIRMRAAACAPPPRGAV